MSNFRGACQYQTDSGRKCGCTEFEPKSANDGKTCDACTHHRAYHPRLNITDPPVAAGPANIASISESNEVRAMRPIIPTVPTPPIFETTEVQLPRMSPEEAAARTALALQPYRNPNLPTTMATGNHNFTLGPVRTAKKAHSHRVSPFFGRATDKAIGSSSRG